MKDHTFLKGFERWLNNTSTQQKDEALAEIVSDVAPAPWIVNQLYVMFGMWHALLANTKAHDAYIISKSFSKT